MNRTIAWCLVVLLGLAVVPGVAAAAPSPAAVDRDARALGETLVAPCCWRETLGSHNSPLADSLRAEVRARLTAGEARAAIERDLVARYGAQVRALPSDWDPRPVLGGLAFVTAAVLLVGLVRWTRRTRQGAAPAPAPAAGGDGRLEDVLDDELAALDA